TIFPLAQYFLKENWIDHWFFIRYADPQFHLRIRFHVTKNENTAPIIHYFNNAIQDYINQDTVWKVQIDTYQREMERYGIELIELFEKLFNLCSETVCKTIALDAVKQDENLRWLSGLKMMDTSLTDFGYSLQEKWALLNTLQDGFGKEFNIDKDSRRQFGQKYRAEKNSIEKILDKNSEQDGEYALLFKPIFEKSEVSKFIIEEIKNRKHEGAKAESRKDFSLNDLMSSYIHMMLNRLFRTQQRAHELVLYDYLFRYYNSLQARQK
ncbi:MAG: thiopeptide-type bacteriocin biosynthesis protein, partial [Bacteroidetes bacterium]|nr:thiopeptide-type bacteriocin biosynthesis protein [Bacteroidota bacterium]